MKYSCLVASLAEVLLATQVSQIAKLVEFKEVRKVISRIFYGLSLTDSLLFRTLADEIYLRYLCTK